MPSEKEAKRKRLEEIKEAKRKRLLAAKAKSEERYALGDEFTEPRILRLFTTRPAKLADIRQVKSILDDIKKFRSFMVDSTEYSTARGYRRGWNEWQCPGSSGKFDTTRVYVASTTRIAKLDVLIEDLKDRLVALRADENLRLEAQQRSKQLARHLAQAGQDEGLACALWHALDTTPPTVGFVYFKRWTMPDGSCWYKVGVSNNPDRRETEQNVLPVAAESIACVDVGSMDRARAIEAIIHQVLVEQRIMDANNRELFYLSIQQASAVKAVLERLA